MIKIGMISLGCAKNLIDSEIMIGHLHEAGLVMTPDVELADIIIVNTCSFIGDAKKESVDTIYELSDAREQNPARAHQKILVAGCLSQRYSEELPDLLPEVDAFIGLDQITRIPEIIAALHQTERAEGEIGVNYVTAKSTYIPDYDTPRYQLTPKHSVYVKIAEGCNHPCSFCIIPKIRGRHRSRSQASVVQEVTQLVAAGAKEINLISQDTTYFGMDKWEQVRPNPRSGVDSTQGESLSSLLRELNAIPGDFWIRLLYTHPAHWSDELIETVARCEKVAKYVDIPLQHISDHMLKLMKRETDGAYLRDLLNRIRKGIPGIAIRTTFIVGFPGETEADFQELLEFIREAQFERAGAFAYSKEEDTRAFTMPGHLHHMTRRSRYRKVMQLLSKQLFERNAALCGQNLRVLVEAPGRARSEYDAPEIDANIYVDESLPVGEFAEVIIKDYVEYDLIATSENE